MSDTTTTTFEGRNWKYWTEPSFVDVDGVPTAYRREGTGETLVYLHGGGGTRVWSPLHQELAKRFDVIAPEHPGFGDTQRPEDLDSWEDFVLHYDALFRALGLDNFHIVGTSLGGWLAADLAIYFPERYKTITLVTPLGLRIEDEPLIDLFRMTVEQDAQAMFNGRQERYEDQAVQEGELDDVIHGFYEQSTSALLMWNPRYDYKLDRRLQRVTAPTLVISVDDDRMVGNLQAPRYAELLPNSTLVTVHGPENEPSGHAVTIEQPADVAGAIATFIADKARDEEENHER